MFKKLHMKLIAYMGLILVFFMLFIAMGIYNFTKYVFEEGAKKLMHSECVRIYAYNEPFVYKGLFLQPRDYFLSISPHITITNTEKINVSYVIYNEKQERVCFKGDKIKAVDSIFEFAVDSFNEKADSFKIKKVDGINYRVYTKYFNDSKSPSVVQVYQNTINEEIIWSFLKNVLFLFGTTGMIILIGISYFFIGKALKPVTETWIRQKEFIADASHELRTPLTVIQTNLDVVLSDDNGTVIENEMWLDNAYSETNVMAKLIDQLLLLAQADANEEKLDLSDISLSEIIENVCDNMKILAQNKKIDFHSEIQDDIIIRADYDKLRRLIVILIDNAIKYTESGKVTVKLFIDKNKKILTVEDTGIGISEKDLHRIFDRFYRADKSRQRQGGTGLGLSIAMWIADSHKFILTVESSLNKGSKFTLKF